MEYIENKTFLHFQRKQNGFHSPLWNVGETHFIGQRKNRYFEFFDYADAVFDSTDAESVLRALNHNIKIIREFIFEEVRKEYFPSHPSRQRCLWVIKQDDTDSLEYWRNALGSTDRLIKVELTGKIHRANQKYLTPTTENLNLIRQKAFHYWTGTKGEHQEEEILFEGFAKVLEVI